MDETKVNAMLQALQAQRDMFANQVVQLQGEIAALQKQLKELEPESE